MIVLVHQVLSIIPIPLISVFERKCCAVVMYSLITYSRLIAIENFPQAVHRDPRVTDEIWLQPLQTNTAAAETAQQVNPGTSNSPGQSDLSAAAIGKGKAR